MVQCQTLSTRAAMSLRDVAVVLRIGIRARKHAKSVKFRANIAIVMNTAGLICRANTKD
ncbi:hypothetical protein PF005_g29999 [Phytophthora fragariae]|uniref:Uncharacterized protein n=1 Tax=Phytophthora fragariae TaxID=53985 RepID=A0A6A4BBJ6_9STRA|nr:hypothetical protein PF009_g30339 [Phytophthora fragariae]KAE8963088.1 hypothetical protein PF011_g29161 [Phytophthora fragariae]KAE9061833.1 hypothetical protein PF010_g29662 [Phytophthora fragariae]KAE9062809.1 hypothetical protein PF007_g29777 [Phytophthora fragariae]KAE9068711.1 hypothetical protein PF006_g29739 [Phytophthora fragariae]